MTSTSQFREFCVSSQDGLAQICGDVMQPSGEQPRTSALLIVPGGWFAERDGFMGDSYTEADLMYRRIGQRICRAGYPVVRYDNRGVKGNEFTIGIPRDSDDPAGDTARYLDKCIDFDIRSTVTPEALVADLTTVFDYTVSSLAVSLTSVVVFGHSEGCLHIARAIGTKRINPTGIFFAGTSLASPVATVRWQMVERLADEVMSWDRNQDGKVTIEDIDASYGGSYLSEIGITAETFREAGRDLLLSDVIEIFANRYAQEKRTALAAVDDDPYPPVDSDGRGFVAASQRWYKQWFQDETSILNLLSDYRGDVLIHNGAMDRQINHVQNAELIARAEREMPGKMKLTIHPNRGHALATSKPITGPMDIDAEDQLVHELVDILRR